MRPFLAGTFRILCAALLSGLLPAATGHAATLRWEALPDRERVTISMDFQEGMAGPVARIDLHGILIPFTRVPPGLDRQAAPPESKIFLDCRQMGRAVVLTTKTPEFGFVIASKTPSELAIDFFPNALGARWKPASPAPVTEIPPESGLREMDPENVANISLQEDPAGTANPVPPGLQPESNSTAVSAPRTADPAPSGSSAQSARAQPPPSTPPVPSMERNPAPPPAPEPEPAVQDQSRPFLDSRRETDPRAAPLPRPEPSSVPALQPRTEPSPALASPPHEVARPSYSGGQPAAVSPLGRERIASLGEPGSLRPSTPAPAGTAAPAPPGLKPENNAAPAPVERVGSGTIHQGSINLGGPDKIPAVSPSPAPANGTDSSLAPSPDLPPDQASEKAGTEPTVVYEDEKGNPVEPPLNPAQALEEIRKDMEAGAFPPALAKTEKLLTQADLTPEQKEEALHTRAHALFALNQDKLADNFLLINDAAQQAINFNQQSYRNAGALLRLGYMNLQLNNIPEARAQFTMLRRKFPDDENVPLTYYYWGDYYFNRNELPKAADEFQYVLQHYPNSRYAREASLGLARSFYRMGYYQESFDVVEYIELRWKRFYLDYPPFLNMMGDVAFRLNKLDTALKHYWTYVNLEPAGEETDVILARIGDIYGMKGEKDAARELYEQAVQRFPDKDGALVAMMRMAEEGINDLPSLRDMFPVFDRRFSLSPADAYRAILEKHPDSALAPLASLKLAMWHLWNKDYINALDVCDSFLKKYPNDELAPKIREVGMQTFSVLATESVLDNRYARMREIWERYPFVQSQMAEMPPESRIALAVSYRDSNRPDEALAAVEPFFLGRKVPEYSEMALNLVLGIYLNYEQWDAVRQVARQIELWELSPEARRNLDFALALAAENLGESAVAGPIWKGLYDSGRLSPHEQALAAFFLAREAERNQELERAYLLGKEALNRLLDNADKNPDTADYGKIQAQIGSLMDVSETAGRLREALEYAGQYLSYLPEDNPARAAVLYRMARICKRQGDEDGWRRQLTEIAQKYPDNTYGKTAASELNSAGLLDNASRYSPTGSL
ncbi:MAG: tetratricopeptide repeat protein [Desulfovibrio sp.]|jgi:TolA-binding protein|nr:tetratricopeptide repeat protein [Desulfovibrio sp.]